MRLCGFNSLEDVKRSWEGYREAALKPALARTEQMVAGGRKRLPLPLSIGTVRAGRLPHPLKLREQNPTPKPTWTGVRQASGDTHLPVYSTSDPRVLLQSQALVTHTWLGRWPMARSLPNTCKALGSISNTQKKTDPTNRQASSWGDLVEGGKWFRNTGFRLRHSSADRALG